MKKTYILKPTMMFNSLPNSPASHKRFQRAVGQISVWWGTRHWKKLSAVLDPWLLGVLEKLRELILGLEAQLDVLKAQLLLRLAGQQRSKGLGEMTLVTLDGEVCDWKRFHNRKQLGSYTGCCPGEHSSGGKRLVGSIDRMGNGRMRALLVEAVWRFLLWQPGWKSAARMKVKLVDGPAMRKKTVVALAPQLAVDLWRWRTGRCTLADLGLIPAYRDQRGLPWLETLWQDVRYGARILRKNPSFTTVAVLTLALGIGANTAVFIVINTMLLRALPFPAPDHFLRPAQRLSSTGRVSVRSLPPQPLQTLAIHGLTDSLLHVSRHQSPCAR